MNRTYTRVVIVGIIAIAILATSATMFSVVQADDQQTSPEGQTGEHLVMTGTNSPQTLGPQGTTPHFFGPYPNYANSPLPYGSISSITLQAGGTGYTNPTVSITDVYNLGSGASAQATVTAGVITNLTLLSSGNNYTAPIITISDPTGKGASAKPNLGGTLHGGIRKFINSFAGIGLSNASTLGSYIPLAIPDTTTFPGCDYYEIALVEYQQKMHTDLPATRLRGYVQLETTANYQVSEHIHLTNPDGTPIHYANGSQAIAVHTPQYLGPIIISTRNRPVRVTFHNLLETGTGGNLFLPVDTTVMGAGMGPYGMTPPQGDMNYTQNRATIHLHGGATPWISDGNPHQWTTPAGETTSYPKGVSVRYVPDMWFTNGHIIPNTVGKVTPPIPGATNSPDNGTLTFYYTNNQSGRLQFYHDHSYGITRLNVYAGEAAPYLITDQEETDMIAGTNTTGINPHHRQVLPNTGIPLVLQDKAYVDNRTISYQDPTWIWGTTPGTPHTGDLWLPHVYMPNQNIGDPSGANPFGRWDYGPWFWPPTTTIQYGPKPNPYYQPGNPQEPPLIPGVPNVSQAMEAFVDTPVVNGIAYPYLKVEPKVYRFRILNAANDRTWNLQLYTADPTTVSWDGRHNTEVKMIPACLNCPCNPPFPPGWPTDGRVGGVPDPTTSGPTFIQIGTEGGFLPAPVVLPNQPVTWNYNMKTFNFGNVQNHTLVLGPAERADVLIDFSQYANKTVILYNDAPAAYPAYDPRNDYYTGDPDNTGTGGAPTTQTGYGPNTRTIMQFRVNNTTPAVSYNLTALNAVFAKTSGKRGVFEVSQPPIIVPDARYDSAYNKTFPSDQYVRIQQTNHSFTTISGAQRTIAIEQKSIHDEMGAAFDEYGRASGFLGLEMPNAQAQTQNFLLYGFASPPVDMLVDCLTPSEPIPGDGTTIWKFTHNGIDTHAMHFHMVNVQVLNRIGWDGMILPPDANELGWKETLRVNPLESCIVAIRFVSTSQPFDIPNCIRPIDPTMPLGATLQGSPWGFVDPAGNAVTVLNHNVNYGAEYMMHCHLLGHEEMDMMHAVMMVIAPRPPLNLTATRLSTTAVRLNWQDNSLSEVLFRVQRATNSNFTANFVEYIVPENTTIYTDNTLSPTLTYYFRIVGTNIVGDTSIYPAPSIGFPTRSINSTPSNTVTVVPSGPMPPAAPSNYHATSWTQGTSDWIRLTWTDNSNNEVGFRLQRALDPNFHIGLATRTVGANVVVFQSGGYPRHTSYYFRIQSFNGAGSSPWVQATPFPITTP